MTEKTFANLAQGSAEAKWGHPGSELLRLGALSCGLPGKETTAGIWWGSRGGVPGSWTWCGRAKFRRRERWRRGDDRKDGDDEDDLPTEIKGLSGGVGRHIV